MNRLRRLFSELKKNPKKRIFSIFLTLGFPDLASTERLIRLAEAEGVDLIELGFPFSDPLADGPVIQRSSEAALDRGVVFKDCLRLVSRLRKAGVRLPILLFSYFNPVFHRGIIRTARELSRAGFDGCLIPDLPPEEGGELRRALRRRNLSLIYFLAPTSTPERIRLIARRTGEFIYYVSSRGVTGARRRLDRDLEENLRRIKRLQPKPLLIGFGISDRETVRHASRAAEGVIVGSALIRRLACAKKGEAQLGTVRRFLRDLRRGLLC